MKRGDETAAADRVLEIGFWWGTSLLELKRAGAGSITAGGASDNDFWAELPGLGERFELVGVEDGERVLFVPSGATAELDGAVLAGAGPHRLSGCARAVVRLGAQAFVLAWSVPVARAPLLPPDPAFARLVAATAVVSVAALGALEQREPADFGEVAYAPPPIVFRALQTPPEKKAKKDVERRRPSGATRGEEGLQGDPRARLQRAKLSAPSREQKRYQVKQRFASLWGADGPSSASVFGPGGSDGVNTALNNLREGSRLGAVEGFGGWGRRGTGPGGGGELDIGHVGTRGPGPGGDGDSPFLAGRDLKKPPAAIIEKHTDVVGGCEKTSVARIIGRNASAIRTCYETELQKDPALAGKVALSFTIGADGAVSGVEVSEDTIGDPALVACMRQRVSRWRFPEPKGGGECVINYPWQLRSAAE